MRGYWWSPDGRSLLVARVDDAPVGRWYIADPANPDREPAVVAYPAAGTPNALVSLVLIGLDGTRVDVAWDAGRDEYLTHAVWSPGELLIVVQPRDQRALRVLQVDPATGATTLVHEDTDRHWVEIVPGAPARTASGALLWITDDGAARRLLVDGEPVTPPTLQVRALLDVDGDTALLSASDDPVSTALWTWSATDGLRCLTPETGVYGGRLVGGTLVVSRQSLDADRTVTTVRPAGGLERTVSSFAEPPGLTPRITLHRAGERALCSAAAAAVVARAGDAAAGAHGPLRRPARPTRRRGPRRAPDQPVVRRAGLRGRGRRRPGHPGTRPGVRACGVGRSRRAGAGRPGRRPARARGRPSRARPDPRGHPRVVVRGLPRRAGRAAPPGRLPRRRRRSAGHRLDLVRHPLHGALPGPSRHPSRRLRADLAAPGRGEAAPARSSWCTVSPTTTWSPRTRSGCRRRCSPGADRTACCRCPGSRT